MKGAPPSTPEAIGIVKKSQTCVTHLYFPNMFILLHCKSNKVYASLAPKPVVNQLFHRLPVEHHVASHLAE